MDIILTNNGYKVVNLGIKQPAETIIHAAQEHRADAIGLSGLLVKSTLEMKYVIQDLECAGLKFPVICGGAALTRKFVEDDLRREYSLGGVLRRRRVCRTARDGKAESEAEREADAIAGRARWCKELRGGEGGGRCATAGCATRSDCRRRRFRNRRSGACAPSGRRIST